MARNIKSGGRLGKKYFYVYETGEVTSSNDPDIEVGSNVYDDGVRKDIREEEIDRQILMKMSTGFVELLTV